MAAQRRSKLNVTAVPKDGFGSADVNPDLLKRALTIHAANQRQGTASTQSRGEVSASKIKLYRQKGTGRARAGSSSSPIRRGGAVAFGPRPGRTRARMSKRERRTAIRGLLAVMAAKERVLVADSWGESPKTKDRVAWLRAAGVDGRVLLVDVDPSSELRRSASNIPNVDVARADSLSFYEIAVANHIVTSKEALDVLQQRVVT